MKSGLVSVTFRELSPSRIVELVAQGGLDGIEWGGDVHAPHGDLETAAQVARLTRDAGLEVLAYGSYYRVCESNDLPFERVIASADALGAPLIRIWAGRGEFSEMNDDYRQRVALQTQQLADRAGDAGLILAFEYHRKTLTETAESAQRLLELVDRPNVKCLWQPDPGLSVEQNDAALRTVLPWLTNLHVFSWDSEGTRLPLAAGESWWSQYLDTASTAPPSDTPGGRAALIEFVADAETEQFLADARTLRSWLAIS